MYLVMCVVRVVMIVICIVKILNYLDILKNILVVFNKGK